MADSDSSTISINGKAVEAASAAVLNLDSSRRVGWAKAYENASKLDDALRDSNIWRGDRDAYRKGLSFMFGLFMEWTKNERSTLFKEVLKQVAGFDAVMDQKLINAGRRKAQSIRAFDEVQEEEDGLSRAAKKAEHADLYRQGQAKHQRAWREAKLRGIESIVAEYGFESVAEMRGVLAKWQEATKREAFKAKELRDARKKLV